MVQKMFGWSLPRQRTYLTSEHRKMEYWSWMLFAPDVNVQSTDPDDDHHLRRRRLGMGVWDLFRYRLTLYVCLLCMVTFTIQNSCFPKWFRQVFAGCLRRIWGNTRLPRKVCPDGGSLIEFCRKKYLHQRIDLGILYFFMSRCNDFKS